MRPWAGPSRRQALAVAEEGGGLPVLDDDAAVGEVDVIGHLAGETHLMGHQRAGHARLGQLLDGDRLLLVG